MDWWLGYRLLFDHVTIVSMLDVVIADYNTKPLLIGDGHEAVMPHGRCFAALRQISVPNPEVLWLNQLQSLIEARDNLQQHAADLRWAVEREQERLCVNVNPDRTEQVHVIECDLVQLQIAGSKGEWLHEVEKLQRALKFANVFAPCRASNATTRINHRRLPSSILACTPPRNRITTRKVFRQFNSRQMKSR